MYNQLNLKYFCDKLCAVCILLCVLCMNGLTAHAADNDEIIEFQGDRYVIHVDKMNPDSEMTLLDVLNTCPEYLSVNGKMIDLNYTLRADNINIIVDQESFLANVKACEIDRIQICSNSSVAKAVGGTKGVIDIYYREDVKTDGKVAVAGSTYGNGMVYADVTNRSEKLTVQGYGMVRTSYGKAYPLDKDYMTDRGLAENLYLNLDWKISQSDKLIIKAFQEFDNTKQKLFTPGQAEALPFYNRYTGLVLSYAHTFKNDALLFAEIGSDYTSTTSDSKMGDDYTHGPWVLTLGDRFRMMNYWNRQYDSEDQSMWTHDRNNHCYLASVGYKAGRHFFQGLFARRFFIPEVNDFLIDETAPTNARRFDAGGYSTNLAHQGVVRYSYQHKNFFLHSSVEGNWHSHLPTPNYQEIGFRNSVFWRTGPWELTLGANYYYHHVDAGAYSDSDHDNFVTLKLAPVLNLSHGFRLSSTLLYSSRRDMNDRHSHLFATVKANKQLGKKCNVFAEFHDIAGYVTGYWPQLAGLYQNRALSVGATFYPFRK